MEWIVWLRKINSPSKTHDRSEDKSAKITKTHKRLQNRVEKEGGIDTAALEDFEREREAKVGWK